MTGRRPWREAVRFVLIGVGLVWSLGPLFLMYSASFKTDDILMQLPPVLLFTPVLDNYWRLFDTPFPAYLWNTIVVASITTVTSLVCGSLAAYSFTRFKFVGSSTLPTFYLVTRMLPRFVLVIPYYLLIRQLGLLNTTSALVITYTSFSLPFVIWLMIGFFKEIPIELEEAGMVDGCILLGWNELLFSLVLAGRDTRTLPSLATAVVSNERGIEWGTLNAMGSLVLLPVIAMALMVQRHIVKGMTLGAVKG
jgi:multiple sugar transport system permease protein